MFIFLPEIFLIMFHTVFAFVLELILDINSLHVERFDCLIICRALALHILKAFKFSTVGCVLNLRRAALHDLIAFLHSSLNQG